MFRDLPLAPRELKATPDVLERIYQASKLGLRGDSLALRASLLPAEFARLKLMDPMAEMAELKGRADAEGDLAVVLMDAAQAGDARVALEVLKHRHDWVAKQSVQVDVNSQISVVAALEAANGRLQRGLAVEVEDAIPVERIGAAVPVVLAAGERTAAVTAAPPPSERRAGKIAAPAQEGGIAPAGFAPKAKEYEYAERSDV